VLSGLDEVPAGLEAENFGGFTIHTTVQKTIYQK
jgi:hypothetical protein